MAKQIVFTTDPESHGRMRDDWLLNKHVLPFYRRKAIAEGEGKNGRRLDTFYDSRDEAYWQRYHQPFVYWFLKLIEIVEEGEQSVAVRNLSWEFAYYIYVHKSDIDDEMTSRCSVPLWFITIRDTNGENVHKNWLIAIDYEGDISIRRKRFAENHPYYFGYGINHDTHAILRSIVLRHFKHGLGKQ